MSTLYEATARNASACAKAAVHVSDYAGKQGCPICPRGLAAFLDALSINLCPEGEALMREIRLSERAIRDSVIYPRDEKPRKEVVS